MKNYSDPEEAWLADAEFWHAQMGEMPPKPDWYERSLEPWVRWTNWILDQGGQPDLEPRIDSSYFEFEESQRHFRAQQIEERAWLIEIDQLRRKYPRLSPRLHVRESSRARGRPRKWSSSSNKDSAKTIAANEQDINISLAVRDSIFIRALYRQYFGKRNRPKDLPPFPEDIAAARWNVGAEMVSERKRREGSKPRKK
ncbi:hypothetical protein [Methylobacterium sp. GC_Met_2]|uniref:hypothetical protein n=1 Tax=Methylobacterium sp. GC_Met_2 TaxID=2937376 RepID=UPI00226BB2A8|nr:hypothetical protein [Methylobacterium sp. GC_Met_2]